MPHPTEPELINFILKTHQADKIPLTLQEINITLKIGRHIQLAPNEIPVTNPYAVGHFKAFNYILQHLLVSDTFPCNNHNLLINQYESNNALYWLRELHSIFMSPIAQYALISPNTGLPPVKIGECGTYRTQHRTLAFSMAPSPVQIQPLLHLWCLNIAAFHEKIKNKINNPYAFTKPEAEQIYKYAEECFLFISCLQPFTDGNNRLGRLVENAFRLKWNLTWKQPEDTLIKLANYQQYNLPQWLKKL